VKQIGLKYFTDWNMTLFALVLFFLSFLFLIYRVYFFERQETIDQLSQLPLNDEEVFHVEQ